MRQPASGGAIAAGIVAAFGLAQCASAALEREQFVAGWPIELPSMGAFFDIPITYEVYRYGRRLDELAVLDHNGEPMPFYRVNVASPVVSEERVTRGVSPIYAHTKDDAVADISVATDGSTTGVTVTRSGEDEPASEVAAYVVDARTLESAPVAIELEWRPLDRPFLGNFSVQHSEELTNWRNVGRGSVGALLIDDVSVTHGRIAIAGPAGGFYRITWDRRISDWQLERVVLISSRETETATFATIDLPPVEVTDQQPADDLLYFDAGGAIPVTSVDLVFAKGNRWANASIHWADDLAGPWRQVTGRRLFYDIDHEGQHLASAPLDVRRVETRYWKVTIQPATASDGVSLRLKYPQEQLRFAANGQPPYMLVGGTLSEEAGADPTFAGVMNALDPDRQQVAAARLTARVVLGGDEALTVPTGFPWQAALLWTALLAAGLTVGWMAIRLAREMFAKP